MRHKIPSLIPAILIHCFLNSFSIFFARVTYLNLICSCFSPFFLNHYHCYLTIIIHLLVGHIVILNSFSQLIQVFLAILESSSRDFILHFLCKSTSIFYNSTNIGCVKFQALLFCAKQLFSMG